MDDWLARLGVGAEPAAEIASDRCSTGCGRLRRREGAECRQCYKAEWKAQNDPRPLYYESIGDLEAMMGGRISTDDIPVQGGKKMRLPGAE